LAAAGVGDLDRVEQLANRGANERDRVLHRGRAQHRRRVEDLLYSTRDQPQVGQRDGIATLDLRTGALDQRWQGEAENVAAPV
jgi:hypothetical protein